MSGPDLDELHTQVQYLLLERLRLAEEKAQSLARERAARDAAEKAERRLKSLLEQLPIGVMIVVVPSGDIVATSDQTAKILEHAGKSVSDLQASGNWPAFHLDGQRYRPGEWPLDRAAGTGETIVAEEIEYRRGNGDRLRVSINAAPVRDEKGQIVAAVATFADITEHTLLEHQLRQSQKMDAVGQLAGGVAHDFNNLLTAITGYSELILAQIDESDPIREDVEEIKKAGDRAASLTRQLLAFSRRQVIRPEVFDLNEVVRETGKMLRRLIGDGIELVTRLDSFPRHVKADRGQVVQILVNLAVNGRDAMPDGGTLTIATAGKAGHDGALLGGSGTGVPADEGILTVTDTGHGIADETLQHIFEPFFTTKEPGKGTGLGLATVYGIVKQHGGDVHVRSQLSRGTTFTIRLPAADEEQDVRTRRPATENTVVPKGEETILLVEDDAGVRSVVRRTLEHLGYRVLAAHPSQAESLFEQHASDIGLLLTDVMMPGIDGPGLYRCLSARLPSLKVLYMTGYAGSAFPPNPAPQEAVALIHKPLGSDALAHAVRGVLDAGKQSVSARSTDG